MSKIDLENIGIHEKLSIEIDKGLLVFTGENGKGKTTARTAIEGAVGGDPSNIEPRRTGYDEHGRPIIEPGFVYQDGAALIRVGKARTKRGTPTVELVDISSLHAIVDPGIKDPVIADEHRLRAILDLYPIEVTDETVALLHGQDGPLEDLGCVPRASVLSAYGALREAANKLALAAEKEASHAEGGIKERRKQHEELTKNFPADPGVTLDDQNSIISDLETKRSTFDGDIREMRTKVEHRATLANIMATLGEEQDIVSAASKVEETWNHYQECEKAVKELERKFQAEMQVVKSKHAAAKASWSAAIQHESTVKTAEEKRNKQLQAVAQINDLPTQDDLDALIVAREELEEQLSASRKTLKAVEAFKEAKDASSETLAAISDLEEQVKDSTATGRKWRKWATVSSRRLGEVLNAAGIPNLTIGPDGLLYYIETDSEGTETLREPFAKRSMGQRVRHMLLLAKRRYTGGVMSLPESFVFALQPSLRRELAREAVKHGLCILTERATDDPSVSSVVLTGDEDSPLFL